MIRIHLSKLLEKREMSQSQLAIITGIRPATIYEIYHEISKFIKVEHLDLICEALNCTSSELIEYIPNKRKL